VQWESFKKYSIKDDEYINRSILLLLEKGVTERLKTRLVDVKTEGENLVVTFMRVLVVKALTILMH